MMVQPSSIRPGSNLHRTAVLLYQRLADHGVGSGRCATGHQTPCPTRRHATLVIRATGEDPGWYDGQVPHPGRQQHPGQALSGRVPSTLVAQPAADESASAPLARHPQGHRLRRGRSRSTRPRP